jgi:hypothetical protein
MNSLPLSHSLTKIEVSQVARETIVSGIELWISWFKDKKLADINNLTALINSFDGLILKMFHADLSFRLGRGFYVRQGDVVKQFQLLRNAKPYVMGHKRLMREINRIRLNLLPPVAA